MAIDTKAADPLWQQSVLSLYKEISPIVFMHVGTRTFLFSGTLLGYSRAGGFISYDKDMDCAYVSLKNSAKEAQIEFAALALKLIHLGYDVTPKASCLAIRKPGQQAEMVDIAMLYIKKDGDIAFPFGVTSLEPLSYKSIFPIKIQEMCGALVEVPRDPARVMRVVYGENWKVPDPNFSWNEQRVRRDSEGLLTYNQRSSLANENFYRHNSPAHPSKFVRWTTAQPFFDKVSGVIDAGSGNARDSRLLSRGGRKVVAVDKSKFAVSAGKTLLKLRDSSIPILHADLIARGTISRCRNTVQSKGNKGILFYARFLLSALTDSEISNLFENLSNELNSGDFVALEFRTSADRLLKKQYFRSFRNYASVQKIQEIAGSSFVLLASEEGQDLAEFKRENPIVARVILEKK